ncbi:GNAT family N-acetyltransferase [Nocardioides sp. Kera G14]|uniref:GNAT family N-acetyltransferase n=1 Tax=Nocardioides sp. Kera G14 TaxID=2884264 RepID=UPI001D100D89|nr:GNAT family N-acetyltransferase [Nocardioides sp. Kera G14]UDY24791.1 GNAT family N-acetyltransferase [Nocardioides sp. Kera G14]
MLRFELDDLTHPAVIRMLEEHLEDMHATSPAESVHALDLESLRAAGIAFWSAWDEDELRATGALKTLSGDRVELKSMRTARDARGQGVGAAMLAHLLGEARGAGAIAVLLETGSQEFFAPARRLYERAGFVVRGPFDDYVEDPNSVFMELALS